MQINPKERLSEENAFKILCFLVSKGNIKNSKDFINVYETEIEEYNNEFGNYVLSERKPDFDLFNFYTGIYTINEAARHRILTFSNTELDNQEKLKTISEEYQKVFQKLEKNGKLTKSIIWEGRNKTEYAKVKLANSEIFQRRVEEYLWENFNFDIGIYYDERQDIGESSTGIELKNDQRYAETGNIAVEYQERNHIDGPWIDSGILKKDNTKYFLFGDYIRENVGSQNEKLDAYGLSWIKIYRKTTLLKLFSNLGNSKEVTNRGIIPQGTSKLFTINKAATNKYSIPVKTMIEEILNQVEL